MASRRPWCFMVVAAVAAGLALPASASATGFWSDPTGADLVANAAPPAAETVRAPARRTTCARKARRGSRAASRCRRLRIASSRLGSRGLDAGTDQSPLALE